MRRLLVTGATGGLGSAVVRRLELSHDVLAPPRSELDFANSPGEATGWIEDAAKLGRFDYIVHCAGSELIAPLAATSDAEYSRMLETLNGAFAILRAAGRGRVCNSPASIVLVTSLAASHPPRGMGAYAAGKAAVAALAASAAVELAPLGIRVNCVAPGTFSGPMFARVSKSLPVATIARLISTPPLGLGSPEDVCSAVEYLLDECSKWVTGTTLHVDGGAGI